MSRNQFILTLLLVVVFAFLGGMVSVQIFTKSASAQTETVITTHELRLVDEGGKTVAKLAVERARLNGDDAEVPYLEFYRDNKLLGGITMELDGGLYSLHQEKSNKLQLKVLEDRSPTDNHASNQ